MQEDELVGGDIDVTDIIDALPAEVVESAFFRALDDLDWDIEQAANDPHNPVFTEAFSLQLRMEAAKIVMADALEKVL